MKILFICKYNLFRSRVAEEYFKKINKNKKITVFSRGIIIGKSPGKEHIRLSKEILNINIKRKKSLPLNIKDLEKADLIVITANDVPKILFNHNSLKNKRIIFWKIKDEQFQNKKNIKHIILKIKKKVEKLNEKLIKNEYRFNKRI
jgi:protein-tyrosine-phosphatase